VAEIVAQRLCAGVEQPLREREAVERLVPVLVRAQDPLADAGHRRGEHQRADRVGARRRDHAGDAAPDVVAHDHRAVEAELVDQAEHARRLRLGAVGLPRRAVVAVGLAEAAQVRHDDVGMGLEPRDDVAVVGAVARPAVQQDGGHAVPVAVVGEAEAVDRRAARH
jgi:hypothetical protein